MPYRKKFIVQKYKYDETTTDVESKHKYEVKQYTFRGCSISHHRGRYISEPFIPKIEPNTVILKGNLSKKLFGVMYEL